jgi:hypothetical protein
LKKECCNVKVSETDKGFCVEVEGDEVKSKVKEVMENCCSKDSKKNWSHSCCPSDK